AGEVGTKIDDGNGFGGSQCDSGSADQGDDRGQTMYGLASARFRWPLISRRRPDGSLGQGLVELAADLATGEAEQSGLRSRQGAGMMKGKPALAALAAIIVGNGSGSAWAQAKGAAATGEGLAAFLRLLTERIDVTFSRVPEVWNFLAGLVHRFDLREA